MSVYLGSLAFSIPQDKFAEEGRHSRPPIISLHVMECAKETFVSSCWGFMEGFHEVEVGWFWDIELVFEV